MDRPVGCRRAQRSKWKRPLGCLEVASLIPADELRKCGPFKRACRGRSPEIVATRRFELDHETGNCSLVAPREQGQGFLRVKQGQGFLRVKQGPGRSHRFHSGQEPTERGCHRRLDQGRRMPDSGDRDQFPLGNVSAMRRA
jgi:hypothetical protein